MTFEERYVKVGTSANNNFNTTDQLNVVQLLRKEGIPAGLIHQGSKRVEICGCGDPWCESNYTVESYKVGVYTEKGIVLISNGDYWKLVNHINGSSNKSIKKIIRTHSININWYSRWVFHGFITDVEIQSLLKEQAQNGYVLHSLKESAPHPDEIGSFSAPVAAWKQEYINWKTI